MKGAKIQLGLSPVEGCPLRLCSLLVTAWLISSVASAAPKTTWDDINVCRAAVSSYFSLGVIPYYLGEEAEAHYLTTGNDRFYLCRASDNQATIWLKDGGLLEQSKPVSYTVKGPELAVTTEFGVAIFLIKGDQIEAVPE